MTLRKLARWLRAIRDTRFLAVLWPHPCTNGRRRAGVFDFPLGRRFRPYVLPVKMTLSQ